MKFPVFNFQSSIFNSKGGFTLLELMVSFVIVGLIALIITSALRLGLHTIDRGEKRIDYLERIRTSMNIINSQIQSQLPLTYEENGEKKHFFDGKRESMQFSTNYSIWNGQMGYVLVKYKVETDELGKQALAISENVIGMDNIRETELFNDLDMIYFEYFSKDPTEESGEWVEEWTDDTTIPEKIKLHLTYEGKHLSMIIPVRTAQHLIHTALKQKGSGSWVDIIKQGKPD